MADNIYLLETRLSKAQQSALSAVREVARERGLTVFLVGGAVRDLIGGTAVRDLDVAVQGNALKIRKDIEKAGGVTAGELEAGQAFFVRFPGGVRMEIGSTLAVTYPKPGKAVFKPATILEDLRRRDFTANAMALSLNEGSYGLLMDPLNGVADIENRELRLVSNYGFIEDPVRMIRAARLMARLGWGMDEKTQARYETGKAEGYIAAMDDFHRGYETEEIFHEEDPLRVMRRLEEQGWMAHLAPALSAEKANVAELERLRESQAQLQTQGVVSDAAASSFPLLTSKMAPKEVEALKKSFPRQGFVEEINGAEAKGKEFAALLGAKGAAQPSQAYKLILASEPEAVLWAAHTTKSGVLQAKFRSFFTEWPQARQRLPYLLLQEMRITPDLADYEALLDKLYFELMDGKLGSPEEMKAFLEPFSPPAPPPPVSLRRPRAPKKDTKPAKSRKKAVAEVAENGEAELGGAELAAGAGSLDGAAGDVAGLGNDVAEPVHRAVAAKLGKGETVPGGAAAAKGAKKPDAGHAPEAAVETKAGAAKGVAAKGVAAAPAETAAKGTAVQGAEAKGAEAAKGAAAKAGPVKEAVAKAPALPAKTTAVPAKTPVVPAKTPVVPAKAASGTAASHPEAKKGVAAGKSVPAGKATPGKAASAKAAPGKTAAAKAAPVKAAAAKAVSVKAAPAKGAAAKSAPAKGVPVKAAAHATKAVSGATKGAASGAAKGATKGAPAKAAVAGKAAAKAPAKKAPAKGASAGAKVAAKKKR